MMTIGEQLLQFNLNIKAPSSLPDGIEVMLPSLDSQVNKIMNEFYSRYYNDNNRRIFLIGINPGRFGGGLTGIPFTDPINLLNELGIANDLPQKHELSSRFIYEVVSAFGGPGKFFGKVYLTAVSPVGFTSNGRNINYYDSKELTLSWESLFLKWLNEQVEMAAVKQICFSLGAGQNFKYLKKINERYSIFERVEALPHPRWVMQYRYKKRNEFIKEYVDRISNYCGI